MSELKEVFAAYQMMKLGDTRAIPIKTRRTDNQDKSSLNYIR